MKVLIWVGCLFVYVIIQTAFQASGIMLGAIPTVILFSIAGWSARTLCKKWDEYSYEKGREKFQKEYKEPTHPPGYVSVVKEADETPMEAEQTEPPQIKFCRKCGFELLDGSEFCSKCGTAIVKE